MDATTLLLVAGGAFFVGLVVVVVVVATASFHRVGVARGLSAIDQVYAAGSANPAEENFTDRVAGPLGARMIRIGRAVTPAGTVGRLRRWLDYAGNPPYWTIDRVYEIKGLALIGAATVGVLTGMLLSGVPGALIGGLLGAVLGYYLPDLVVYELADRRQESIRRTLPDILDTLTVNVEAGLGFDAALAQVTHYGRGPMASEFARTLQEIQLGLSRAEALRALGRRSRVIELKTFCAIVVQATELGIPIANVLREQSKEMRIRRRQRAEELAQKVPVKILFPLVFCLFPALFIVVLGPGIINILNSGLFS
ncbi:type II secretion system F family protein [Micromonospora echinofusca]|uniref:Type II secretion system F family protein n=1 Tax=Micromonospora echinofusca TaxID=47858 RepID=A0ABS3VNX2_MICEH|nr:type II secretion system F family protein [Micromonospora echinofusca]MBO4206237.1 type II secretion system F family protein [Micromonospora echinofusca]